MAIWQAIGLNGGCSKWNMWSLGSSYPGLFVWSKEFEAEARWSYLGSLCIPNGSEWSQGERHFDAGSGRRPPHHLRTANPILSTFATVRHRTIRAKGCLSSTTALAMVLKLAEAAQKSWQRLHATTSCGTLFSVPSSGTGSKSARPPIFSPEPALEPQRPSPKIRS